MKKVLVYGDSNTWGDNFLTGERIPDDKQWVNILNKKYSDEYLFLQEGLPGRIAGNEDISKPFKNGKDTFLSVFRTSAPVDILIIALGTNDLQIKYDKTSNDIINDLLWYKKVLEESYEDLEDRKKYFKNEKLPKLIYILPINFDYKVDASVVFNESSEKKRKEIIEYFKNNKKDFEIIEVNNAKLFKDGIHLNYEGHEQIVKAVESVVMEYEQ